MNYDVLPAAFRDDANGTDLPQPVQANKELMVSYHHLFPPPPNLRSLLVVGGRMVDI